MGISIGHKDSDNVFRGNRVTRNRSCGLFFRDESAPMGAHRNVFEKNVFLDNGRNPVKGKPAGCIVIRGHHHDLVLRGNTIGYSESPKSAIAGILADPRSQRLSAEDNDFRNVSKNVALRGKESAKKRRRERSEGGKK